MYDTLVFIGRFQPLHEGHVKVIKAALAKAKRLILVIGSHDQAPDLRNPWTTAERIAMITAAFPREVAEGRIVFAPQIDHRYSRTRDRHTRWVTEVTRNVTALTEPGERVGLIGHAKDSTSFYLKRFPRWDSVAVENHEGLSATDLRARIFQDGGGLPTTKQVPAAVRDWIAEWGKGDESRWAELAADQEVIEKLQTPYANLPYRPTFNTVDTVLVQSGHVLLTKRGARPGKGLWALPGGFVGEDEDLLDGAIRILRNKTRLALPEDLLRSCVSDERTFADPHRSLRGRIITHGFYIPLSDRTDLPKIKAANGAAQAEWVPLGELRRSEFFEDHYDIIEVMASL